MSDREFYRVILGLAEPWEVPAVKVDAERQKVEVQVGYRAGTLWACPESRERLPVHDPVERSWRHLDMCQFETVLVCRVPRRRLADGKVWTAPWAEQGSRFTRLFERLAVTVLQMARSVQQAADWLRLDWDAVQRVLERAVEPAEPAGPRSRRTCRMPAAPSSPSRPAERDRPTERRGPKGTRGSSDQTGYSLELLTDSVITRAAKLSALRDERDQLLAIFTTIPMKSKYNPS